MKLFNNDNVNICDVEVVFFHPDNTSRFYDLHVVSDNDIIIGELCDEIWNKYNIGSYWHYMEVTVTPKHGDISMWRYNGYDVELL